MDTLTQLPWCRRGLFILVEAGGTTSGWRWTCLTPPNLGFTLCVAITVMDLAPENVKGPVMVAKNPLIYKKNCPEQPVWCHKRTRNCRMRRMRSTSVNTTAWWWRARCFVLKLGCCWWHKGHWMHPVEICRVVDSHGILLKCWGPMGRLGSAI